MFCGRHTQIWKFGHRPLKWKFLDVLHFIICVLIISFKWALTQCDRIIFRWVMPKLPKNGILVPHLFFKAITNFFGRLIFTNPFFLHIAMEKNCVLKMPHSFYSGNSTLGCYAFFGHFCDILWKQYTPSIEFNYMSPICYIITYPRRSARMPTNQRPEVAGNLNPNCPLWRVSLFAW